MSFRIMFSCGALYFLTACSGSPYGDTKIHGEELFAQQLELSSVPDMGFPGNYTFAGDDITVVDLNEILSGSDLNMTYTCYFDLDVDGVVTTSQACDLLPGVSSFDTDSAIFNWTTDVNSPGAYEVKISGTDIRGRTAEQVFVVSVRPNYVVSSSLIKDHSRFFSLLSSSNSNSGADENLWYDLVDTGSTGTLMNFNYDLSSGWSNSDNSLIFDGVNDVIQHGVLSSHTNFTLSSWIKPLNFNEAGAVLFGTYNAVNQNGFEIRQSDSGSGQVELRINFESYSVSVSNSAPVSFYKLDETSGSVAVDSGTAGVDGTYNTVTLNDVETAISSEPAVSALFNGSSSHVDLGNDPVHQITGDQSIEMWVRPTSFSARRNPFAKAYGGEGTITQETNGRLNYYYGTNGGNAGPFQGFSSNVALSLNTWHHIVLVRNLGAGTLHWYINGVQTNTTGAAYAAATAGGLSAYIGRGYVSNQAGQMSHVALYDKALSAAEVLNHYDAAAGTSCISTATLSNGNWYHIGATYDGTTHKLYINNTEECSITKAYTPSSLPFSMGGLSSSNNWNGEIGSFRFYSVGDSAIINTNYTATQSYY